MSDEDETLSSGGPESREIAPISIEEEMKRSYIDYAMSVIVARAIPDARDGLKPVHRRILYAMGQGGFSSDKPYRKSARIVGDVMGRYHPHGDQAIYDAMVRMAQDFSMRLPLLDGQGNFGSIDNDPPAAMRYTEIRLDKPAESLLEDIDKDTVDFQENYDGSAQEPVVLPATFPNLLVNGANGIAVGMATNIPTHNLAEVVAACQAYIEDREIEIDALMEYVPGPDFPTGGIILGRGGIRSAYHTGRGSIIMRGRTEITPNEDAIIVTEIPYQVNKAGMLEKISEAVRAKRIEGISEIRDESDRHGIRVVVELRRDANADVVLNQLYRFSPLQTSFGINLLALNRGRPEQMNLKQVIAAFVEFREEVVTRRTRHLLGKARDRAHILVGLAIAVANIDAVIALIRGAATPAEAREQLMTRDWPATDVAPLIRLIEPDTELGEPATYRMSEEQARAILDLRLQRLTALGRDEIAGELEKLVAQIQDYVAILNSQDRVVGIVRDELNAAAAAFADPKGRRTEIGDALADQDDEDLITPEDVVVTVTMNGYVKRVPLDTYRPQRRGGKGRSGMSTRDEDVVTDVFVVNTHTPVLFFSSAGQVYKLKAYRLPVGAPQARGKALVNILPLEAGETIHTVMPMPEGEEAKARGFVMFATASGNVRRNALSDFERVPSNGKIAMKLDEGDRIVGVKVCGERDDILLAARGGKCMRFPVIDVRVFKSRDSTGVRGMKLGRGDELVSMSILQHRELEMGLRDSYLRWSNAQRRAESGEEANGDLPAAPAEAGELAENEEFVLSVTENGYGKRSSSYEYRTAGRGGQGIINIETSARNGDVVAAFPVARGDQIILVTDAGKLIRCPVDDIRIAGRNTQGVTLFSTDAEEKVVSVAHLAADGEHDEGENGTEEDGEAETGTPE